VRGLQLESCLTQLRRELIRREAELHRRALRRVLAEVLGALGQDVDIALVESPGNLMRIIRNDKPSGLADGVAESELVGPPSKLAIDAIAESRLGCAVKITTAMSLSIARILRRTSMPFILGIIKSRMMTWKSPERISASASVGSVSAVTANPSFSNNICM